MKESQFVFDFNEEEESFNIKNLVSKYFRHWPWFLFAVLVCVGLGYLYMRYAPITYESVAKIKIVDESKEVNVVPDALAMMTGNSNINLDNEVEVLRSYRLLRQVVSELHLDISYYQAGQIKTTQIWNPPFEVVKNIPEDSLSMPRTYEISIQNPKFVITDEEEKVHYLDWASSDTLDTELPFRIELMDTVDSSEYKDITYKIVLLPFREAVLGLAKDLKIEATNKNSEILSLSMQGESPERSETILNTIIGKFDLDGITDRQLVARRTLEVIDRRFVLLSGELDSIELGKQNFKQLNALSYIEADAGLSLQRKTEAEDDVIKLETQISLAQLLKETVANEASYGLLPADIGLENSGLNTLVFDYNEMALKRDKLLTTVGRNHPMLKQLSMQMEQVKLNILNTVNGYQNQLLVSLQQLSEERNRAGFRFSKLPEKEKTLRSIERQQTIKEQLFLLLLEKREEAAIKLATTVPSVKVVDYALTASKPLSPKITIVYPLSFILGVFLPFLVLYTRFSLDTKIRQREDVEKLSVKIPLISEIPYLKGSKAIQGFEDRSVIAEAFRMLSAGINNGLPSKNNDEGQIIYVTSSIQGEGKTFVAYNLAVAYASLGKRVLLVGADLRNPQLHAYLDILKKAKGMAEYLSDTSLDWQDVLNEGFSGDINIKVCFSRKQPPNAPGLLSGKRFGEFINAVKGKFNYIIVDTAPTIPVSDTFLISQYADMTLFVSRAGLTEKRVVDYANGLAKNKKLRNMAYVLNGVGKGRKAGYNYGYGYGYGSD